MKISEQAKLPLRMRSAEGVFCSLRFVQESQSNAPADLFSASAGVSAGQASFVCYGQVM